MANIVKRGNAYRIRVSCGFDGAGKRITKSKTFVPPNNLTPKQAEREAERQAVLFEEQCRKGAILDENTRFAVFSDMWIKNYAEKQLKATTLARYKELLLRINAAFGNMKLSAIQPHHLLAFYDNLAESGIRQDTKYSPKQEFFDVIEAANLPKDRLARMSGVAGSTVRSVIDNKHNLRKDSAEKISAALGKKLSDLFEPLEDSGLSERTILHHHRLLSSMLTTAVQWQLLFSNPCQRIKPPKVHKTEARYLNEEQTAETLKALQNEPYQYNVIVQLLLYTGMRRGELCGLEWQDFDYETSCIHIRRNSLYIPEKGVFEDTPKNDTSDRVIKLSVSATNLLRDFCIWQNERKNELGSAWINSRRIFTAWNGKPINPDTITAWFHEFIIRHNLPPCSIHSLRHTNATLLIASGAPIKVVSDRLGHSTVSTTVNIYTHSIKSADEAAAEALDDILAPKMNTPLKIS